MTLATDDGYLFGNLGGITRGQDDPGLRIDEVSTHPASKKRPCKKSLSSEACRCIDLLLQLNTAGGAGKLTVESLLDLDLGCELVLVSFDETTCKFGVHLFDYTHEARVAEWQRPH